MLERWSNFVGFVGVGLEVGFIAPNWIAQDSAILRKRVIADVRMTLRNLRCYRSMFRFRIQNLAQRCLIMRHFNVRRTLSQSAQTECTGLPHVRTRIAPDYDWDRVIEFMSKSYFKREPSLVNIGLADEASTPSCLIHLTMEQIKQGMTIIAEGPDNCVIGAAVNAATWFWDPLRVTEFAETCCEAGPVRDVIKFYAYLSSAPKLWCKYGVRNIFECSAVAVDPEYSRMGIGKRLIKESWYLARDCGYKLFRIDCTSRHTARIAESFGWECVCTLPYKSYIDTGGLVFKHIKEPHTEVQIYVDQPFHCKDYCPSNPENCKIGTAPK